MQDFSCPGTTFAFCSHGQKLPRQGGYPESEYSSTQRKEKKRERIL